jgi:methylase of polypeptide subunit release factors
LPSTELAFDIGTGTGVVSALLAKRGVRKIIATDLIHAPCVAQATMSSGLD